MVIEEKKIENVSGGAYFKPNDLKVIKSNEGKYFAAIGDSFSSEGELKAYIKGMSAMGSEFRKPFHHGGFRPGFNPHLPRFPENRIGPAPHSQETNAN
jgi:hypothetical protein